jgi:hypothetical protein
MGVFKHGIKFFQPVAFRPCIIIQKGDIVASGVFYTCITGMGKTDSIFPEVPKVDALLRGASTDLYSIVLRTVINDNDLVILLRVSETLQGIQCYLEIVTAIKCTDNYGPFHSINSFI